jgi:L-alanine-DL-glutamate epimerase-like enolase superfamily enzyme
VTARITAIETVRLPDEHPELIWVRVQDSDGVVGLGETMPRPGPVDAAVHDILAPLLLGSDGAPEAFWQRAFQAISYHGYAGAELRALSAVDIALWDLLGKRAGLPVHRLLGGPCRSGVPVYNTCVGYRDIDDHRRFLDDPVGLAHELADAGYTGMKIWPFDELSKATLGQRATRAQLSGAVAAFADIHAALGARISVALEGHSCWSLPAATLIAQELAPYRPMWLEDLMHAGTPQSWVQLRAATDIPVCGSERLFTRWGVEPFILAGAFDVLKQDVCWTGGFTEFVKIAALAAAHDLPVAPHNCHGPIGAMATVHASAAIPNLYLMESVRSFALGFFDELSSGVPTIDRAQIAVPERPGLGVELREDVLDRATRRRTTAEGTQRTGWADGDPWAGGIGNRL